MAPKCFTWPMPLPEKHRVLERVVAKLNEGLSHAAQSAEETRRDATHEEAKPENDKDTRALEQSYLARGQAMRAELLAERKEVLRFMPLPSLTADSPVCSGALVELSADDGSTRVLFMAPHCGGTEVQVDGLEILVVTPGSPLGAAILGRQQGDDVSLTLRGRRRSYVISEVR
jgi:transcription elongation GreA/GreB family factor